MAFMPSYPCRNPNCKSYGKPHPNCRCGDGGVEHDAKGGVVGHHCEEFGVHYKDCEYYADGGEIAETQEIFGNPDSALEHAIASHGLKHAMTKMGYSRSENPHKPAEDFVTHARRGHGALKSHVKGHFDPKHEHQIPEAEEIDNLGSRLEEVQKNPSLLLDMGGDTGDLGYSAAMGAKAATASDYFQALRPKQPQPGPLDVKMKPSKIQEQNYRRQLGIAERPLSVLHKAKNGTIQPADLQTMNTLYPKLMKSLQEKVFESLVEAKAHGKQIPHKQRIGLSMLLGQPVDASMTQASLQAIIQANAGARAESQGMQRGQGPTEETQKTIKGVDKLYQTPLERIETRK